jgi:uroporphyrinogen III methyltransferase / synthase
MSLNNNGIVYLVGAGPGDPGLITVKGMECLERADVVVYDRLANPSLLGFAAQAVWLDVGKQPDHHKVTQTKINQILVEHASRGKVVVRLKGGDPFVFGRGGEEAAALAEAGIPFEIVPGVTSAIAAPAYAGIPVTHRDQACSVAFITGHRANNNPDCAIDWKRLADGADTLVFLMGVHNLPEIVHQLLAGGRSPETPVALIEQGTLACQKTVVGTLEDIVARGAQVKSPAIILVGEVVRLRQTLAWYEDPARRPLLGLRVLNTRPEPAEGHDDFNHRLQELGAQPVELSTTILRPVADPTSLWQAINRLLLSEGDPATLDWLIFTSANAVNYFMRAFFSQGVDARRLGRVRIAAIGKATAIALGRFHLMPDFIPQRSTSLDLVEELGRAYDLNGCKILLPRSSIAPVELPESLEALGAQVEAVTVYEILPAEPNPQALAALLNAEMDVVTFFSPSAVTGLAARLAQEGSQLAQVLAGITVACIGPTTAQAGRELGLQITLVPDTPGVEGMLNALIRHRQAAQVG